MASIPLVLPSARTYVGPGDGIFGYDRIWIVLYAGEDSDTRGPHDYRLVQGRHGADNKDFELLSKVLKLSKKGTASA
jgi:hypothetical protein